MLPNNGEQHEKPYYTDINKLDIADIKQLPEYKDCDEKELIQIRDEIYNYAILLYELCMNNTIDE